MCVTIIVVIIATNNILHVRHLSIHNNNNSSSDNQPKKKQVFLHPFHCSTIRLFHIEYYVPGVPEVWFTVNEKRKCCHWLELLILNVTCTNIFIESVNHIGERVSSSKNTGRNVSYRFGLIRNSGWVAFTAKHSASSFAVRQCSGSRLTTMTC